jgi:hypothetical protein
VSTHVCVYAQERFIQSINNAMYLLQVQGNFLYLQM